MEPGRVLTPARRPLVTALLVGLVTTIVLVFLVPVWTLAGPGALGGSVDVLFAAQPVPVPGGVAGSSVFAIMGFIPNRRAAAITQYRPSRHPPIARSAGHRRPGSQSFIRQPSAFEMKCYLRQIKSIGRALS